MRGDQRRSEELFSYVRLEGRIPKDHPLRAIRALVNEVLAALSSRFEELYSHTGRPSIAPEYLLRATLLQAFFTVRSERQLMEQIDYNLLFRWFVGLSMDDAVWDASTFSKNCDRLLEADVARKFLATLLSLSKVRRLLSSDHFSVDGTLLEAWASMKSFRPKDGSGEPPKGGRNGERNFRREKRSNETHASTTDPDAKLYRKGDSQESRLCYIGHVLMENRNGLAVADLRRQPRHRVSLIISSTSTTSCAGERGITPHDATLRSHSCTACAAHALDIFTRVGLWNDSIASNKASVQAAKAEKSAGDQMHGQDYLVYAYLQLGQDKNARAVIDDMAATGNVNPDSFPAFYALAASPARYMVERGDWKGAAELQVRPSKFPHVMAITYFARALGAARSGNPGAAKEDIVKLVDVRDKLTAAKVAYWPQIVDIQQQIATAWTLYAEGKYDDAIRTMSAAAAAEDDTEKHPVTPGALMPARELYGYMLLDRGMAKEALAAFEATMTKEPNRFNDYVGAAKAEQALGDKAKAKAIYEKLVALAGAGDSDRPVLAEAKAFVASN